MATKNVLPPVHPGEIIREDILPDSGLSVTGAAKALGVSRQMFHEILAERKPISAVMCLKVARLFGSTPEFWARLQAEYDLKVEARDKKVMAVVRGIVPLKTHGAGTRQLSGGARTETAAGAIKGKYSHVVTTSASFIKGKRGEVELEDRG